MSEWKEYKLGEIISLHRGYDLPSSQRKKGTIPIVSSSGISDYHDSYKMLPPGVVTGRYGTIGEVFFLNEPYWPLNTTLYIDDFKGNDPLFIYYFLKSFDFEKFNDKSTIPGINRNHLYGEVVKIPSLDEQKQIASILSSLDDKIDLLNRENATLEAMAETLFRQWFIEEAKDDWEEVLITELFEVKDGTHDTPKPQSFGHKLITSKYIHDNSIDFNGAYNISDIDFYNINKRSKVEANDILFSMIGTIGLIYLEQNEKVDYAIKNVGLIKTSQNPQWKYYVYLWFKSELGFEWIHENKTGSTQEYISLNSLRNIKFKIRDYKQIQDFNQIVNDYFTKFKTNQQQIQTLIYTRDGLLSKLMSNEINV